MECVASTLHTTSEHGVSSITTADAHTTPPADLNGLLRFAERRNLVSALVLSESKRTLALYITYLVDFAVSVHFHRWKFYSEFVPRIFVYSR